MLRARSNNKYR